MKVVANIPWIIFWYNIPRTVFVIILISKRSRPTKFNHIIECAPLEISYSIMI